MKMKLLALAVSTAVALPGVVMADGPTIYGKMNLSLENVDVDTGGNGADASADRWEVLSNSSRFGIKGDGKINNALKATYLIEWEVSGEGDATDMNQRNRSVGLAGNFGALDVGKFDTPTKVSQGKIDQFNDLSGDVKFVLTGDTRAEDIIQYTTPSMNGLQGKLAFMPGEQFDVGGGDNDDGIVDAFSASLTYTSDMIYAAVSHDSDVPSDFYLGTIALDNGEAFDPLAKDSAIFDTTRLVGQFTSGPIQVGAMYQMAESAEETNIELLTATGVDVEQDGFLLSGSYTMGQTVLKVQYIDSTTELSAAAGEADIDANSFGLGVDQKLSAQTTVFGYYNMLTYEYDTPGADEE